jgi:hypothetical protein
MAKGLDYVINLLDGSSSGVEKAKSKIGEVENAVDGAHAKSNAWAKTIGTIGLMIGGVFATEKIIDFGKEALNSAKEIRMASAQVAQGITTTGGFAGKTLEELKSKAEELEHTTLFGDEQTMGADALLLTFTKIRGNIFDQAIPAIQDLATRMGGEGPADLKGAAIQVGKALNDPLRGITALQRVGVSFTQVQKDQIDNFVSHNQLAKAQKLILAELNTEFGGSAVAARQAAGPQADLKVAYENLLKAVGPLIYEGLTPLIKYMAIGVKKIVEFVEKFDVLVDITKNSWQWLKKNADMFEDLAIGIGVATVAFAVANPTVLVYTGALIANGIAQAGLAVVTGILTAAQWALNVALSANPIGLVITAVGALIGGLIYAYKHSENFRAAIAGMAEVAKSTFPIFKGLGDIIAGVFTFDASKISKGFGEVSKGIRDFDFKKSFIKGAGESLKESAEQEKKDKQQEAALKIGGVPNTPLKPPGKTGKQPALTTGGTGGTSASGGESAAGGRSVKNLTITFQSMIKEFTMNVTNLRGEDGTRLRRLIEEHIAAAAADAEILAGD